MDCVSRLLQHGDFNKSICYGLNDLSTVNLSRSTVFVWFMFGKWDAKFVLINLHFIGLLVNQYFAVSKSVWARFVNVKDITSPRDKHFVIRKQKIISSTYLECSYFVGLPIIWFQLRSNINYTYFQPTLFVLT